ncbi:MAG: ABC transporter substrate-binding protein [Alphaproteobacteria bacterium]|nr:ABC transporter substrate-binding protein [Alphaproteobacteria bacterium]
MIPRRQIVGLVALAALSPFLPGCDAAPIPLSIASHPWPGYELIFLARREGWLADADIRLIEVASATESMRALTEGRVLGATLTLDEVLRVRAAGLDDLTVVLVFDVSAGADMVVARPDIRALSDLTGRRIGFERTALGALMLDRLLNAANLPNDAVETVPLTIDAQLAAWREGRVDAMITYQPTAKTLLAEGAVPLFDSRALPELIFDVLAVRAEAMARHAARLRALIAGHFRGLNHWRRNPVDAGYRMAGRLGVPGHVVTDLFRGLALPNLDANQRLLRAESGGILVAARILSTIMVGHGLLTGPPALDGLVRHEFLPQSVS